MIEGYTIRTIRPEEAEQAAGIEQTCFPPNEACPWQAMLDRVRVAADCFLVAEERETGRIVGYLNGIATEEEHLRDAFFTDAGLHQPEGRNMMLLGFAVLPSHQGRGLGTVIMESYVQREKQRGRGCLILTCLERLVPMYEHLGYTDRGISQSVWGGETWHEMAYRLR